jgi:hypothetical protein
MQARSSFVSSDDGRAIGFDAWPRRVHPHTILDAVLATGPGGRPWERGRLARQRRQRCGGGTPGRRRLAASSRRAASATATVVASACRRSCTALPRVPVRLAPQRARRPRSRGPRAAGCGGEPRPPAVPPATRFAGWPEGPRSLRAPAIGIPGSYAPGQPTPRWVRADHSAIDAAGGRDARAPRAGSPRGPGHCGVHDTMRQYTPPATNDR